jgi:hypothetical protein
MANGHARAVPEIAAAAMAIWLQAGGAGMGAVRIGQMTPQKDPDDKASAKQLVAADLDKLQRLLELLVSKRDDQKQGDSADSERRVLGIG